MKLDAVVYKTNTGFSKKYATYIADKLDLKLVNYKDMAKTLSNTSNIIYIAPLCAGIIEGHRKVIKRYNVYNILAVGMSDIENINISNVAKVNNIIQSEGLIYLPGGLDFQNLTGIKKFIMKMYLKRKSNLEGDTKEDSEKIFNSLINNKIDKTDMSLLDKIIEEYTQDGK